MASFSTDSQVRVRFITDQHEYRVPETSFVLPASLQRLGLSQVINHLLNLNSKQSVAFDFAINNQLLRSSLYQAVKNQQISLEETITITYFSSIKLSSESKSCDMPAWIGSLDTKSVEGIGFAGCFDGSVKIFSTGYTTGRNVSISADVHCHNEPIRSLVAWKIADNKDTYIATASKDCDVKVTELSSEYDILKQIKLSGHTNSVESIALWQSQDEHLILSGDWNGNIFAWRLPNDHSALAPTNHVHKKRRGKSEAIVTEYEGKPLFTMKGHGQAVTSIKTENSVMYSSSWDHTIKIWDLDNQNCLTSLNCSKVVTSLDSNCKLSVLASSHPDGKIRIWDSRSRESSSSPAIVLGKDQRQQWMSQVRWVPDMSCLTSVDYSGLIYLWDLRSTIPLNKREVHKNSKVLALDCLHSSVYTGGSDCCLMRTDLIL